MKNYQNKIYIGVATFICLCIMYGCSDYLDVVPDKKSEVEVLFERKNTAQGALAACYSFLPQGDVVYHTLSFASEELVAPFQQGRIPGLEIARGRQDADGTILGWWDDYSYVVGQQSLWKGIRYCNTFIENVDNVLNMEYIEKQQWKSEAIFLKAYYHFLLFCQYGPVPIVDTNLPISSSPDEVRVHRQHVDTVINYIVRTIDAAMQYLPPRYTETDAGRVDRVIAAAIKSRVLLYAASPLYNGNAQFYDRFKGKNGELLFNVSQDENEINHKWELAAQAAKEAIDIALTYTAIYAHDSIANPICPKDSALYDVEDTVLHLKPIRAIYDYRYMMTDPWNKELIWGRSYYTGYYRTQAAAFPMSTTIGTSQGAAWSWAVPTLDIVEAYYTKNGLPIDEDRTFNYDRRYNLQVMRTGRDTLFIIKNASTPMLHQNREPRFYASIAFDRGYLWIWDDKWTMHTLQGEANGKASGGDYSPTGYILAKIQHLKAKSDSYANLLYYPWPIIRLGELYLNYAEALNEWKGPSAEVYDALNIIRRRAAIPDVETSWSDPNWVKNPDHLNWHTKKEGLREIIHAERRIELAFEGNRYFDIRRWKEGEIYLTKEIRGWSVDKTKEGDYYMLDDDGLPAGHVYNRSFIAPRDYLFPISRQELNVNSNLVQNPGW